MSNQLQLGSITVICGPMFAGKTEEIIRRLVRYEIAKKQVQVFKPELDNRYEALMINSHSGRSKKAFVLPRAEQILPLVAIYTEVIVIDEVQFFDSAIVKVCRNLANRGMRVIAAGLDLDFRGEPFGPMPFLLAEAENVVKLSAVCMSCGGEAHFTQRLFDGKPVPYKSEQILVGGQDFYEPRCRECHEVPGRQD